MNFTRKRFKKSLSYHEKNTKHQRLMFYKDPPLLGEITLEEFEKFAVERLKLLREVENASIRFKRDSDEYNIRLYKLLTEFLPTYTKPITENASDKNGFMVRNDKEVLDNKLLASQENDRQKDHISHFILRLVFAQTDDLRRWFINQELELFRFRFKKESNDNINQFLIEQNLHYTPIDENEKSENMQHFKDCLPSKEIDSINGLDFYKVPFTDVLDLVRVRKVFLKDGYAYVPHPEIVSIILGIFRSQLSLALSVTARRLPFLEEDSRLLPMLKHLSSAYIGENFFDEKKTSSDDKLTLKGMNQASKTSYPICMRNLHEGVLNDHHLKYFGRMQYGLFIKAAGLSLDEALTFWRTEFTKKMDVEKFEKQYAYNVRHVYGKEGKRQDKSPYNCLKIITSNQPGAGDYHGCPFKHSDTSVLQKKLQSYNLSNDSAKELTELVKKQHFQIACARYFEITHKIPEGSMNLNHPNEYYLESQKLLKGDQPIPMPKIKTEVSMNTNDSCQDTTIKDGLPDDFEFDVDNNIVEI